MEGATNLQAATTSTVLKMSMNPNGRKILHCFKGEKTDKGVTKMSTWIVDVVAIAGVTVAIIAMITSGVLAADITGGLIIFFSPYMALQKRVLAKLGTFRHALNEMRRKVNEFMTLNDGLKREVDELEASVTKLEKVENQLTAHAKTDKENLDHLVKVVQRRKEINSKMNEILETEIIQDLVSAVLLGDFNNDMKVSKRELKNLTMSLDNKKGFDLNKKLFMEMLGNIDEPIPVEKVIKVIRNLKDPSIAEENCVFVLKPQQVIEQ